MIENDVIRSKLISSEELSGFGDTDSLASKTGSLLKQQIATWQLCSKNYSDLKNVEVKQFDFDDFSIKVQFNPGRIVSSSAKVDSKSIKERKCFLCPQNLPREQKGLLFGGEYFVLVNPFPIFPEHFTLPKFDHLPQNIIENFNMMLQFARGFDGHYTVFYNGPKCGASAPDHMHFQAGNHGFMPVDTEYDDIVKKFGNPALEENDVRIYTVTEYLRNFISIEGESPERMQVAFEKFYSVYEKLSQGDEPMMNIIASYRNGTWRVLIFPRQKHRPEQYFREDERRILLSPAAVDLGGVCITPREEDFRKINQDDITDIYRQVSANKEYILFFKKELQKEAGV
ncbi:MAG: DUF4922 domain-containing protein [Melioribacteraceae bacterium]|nr:MAG: DUF4922 domain-containing protein [Melioribacteraceae bacterium]